MSEPIAAEDFALALAHEQAGRLTAAKAGFQRILAAQPGHAGALHRLGLMALAANRPGEAVELIQRAIAVRPGAAEFHHALGRALHALDRPRKALAACLIAVRLAPESVSAQLSLGRLLAEERRFDEARQTFEIALGLQPDSAEAHAAFARVLKQAGRWPEALAHLRRAIALDPERATLLSALIVNLHYQPTTTAAAIRAEQTEWNRRHAEPLRTFLRPHEYPRDPARQRRIGYVSPNFRSHAETAFVVGLLEEHDRAAYEVHCYASVKRPDEVTARLQQIGAVIWHDVLALSDAELAEKIRADGMDILVDLAMHWSGGRLLTFARRPAPVQVSWLVFIDDVGLDCYDYRISDALLDPPGGETACEGHVIRLPTTWSCFRPLGEYPPISPSPAASTGRVTFGALNNVFKVNDAVLRCWTRILAALPGSALLLECPDGEARQRVLQTVSALGLDSSRIEFVGRRPLDDYRRLYERIDIALDPFPCNGGATTTDALWMGVPVVTLCGVLPVGRIGLTLLTNVGLPDLVTYDEEDYVRCATALAGDLSRLATVRATLRTRMTTSPLMDGARFARDVESAYRRMWHRWCATA